MVAHHLASKSEVITGQKGWPGKINMLPAVECLSMSLTFFFFASLFIIITARSVCIYFYALSLLCKLNWIAVHFCWVTNCSAVVQKKPKYVICPLSTLIGQMESQRQPSKSHSASSSSSPSQPRCNKQITVTIEFESFYYYCQFSLILSLLSNCQNKIGDNRNNSAPREKKFTDKLNWIISKLGWKEKMNEQIRDSRWSKKWRRKRKKVALHCVICGTAPQKMKDALSLCICRLASTVTMEECIRVLLMCRDLLGIRQTRKRKMQFNCWQLLTPLAVSNVAFWSLSSGIICALKSVHSFLQCISSLSPLIE